MKKAVIIIVIIVIAIVAWLGLRGSPKNQSDNQQTANTNQSAQNQTETQNQKAAAANQVTISNFAFKPANITVKKGTKVTWTNQDSTAHTVTETDGKAGPNSTALSNGQSYSFTYAQAGTFSYHCSIHPEMTGSVTVTD